MPVAGQLTRAVVFDVDGTLCDVSSVRHLLDADDAGRFDRFHLASAACPPNGDVVAAAMAASAGGAAVIVVTGRMGRYRGLTQLWLDRHDVPWDLLLTRADNDYRPDDVVKRELLREIRGRGYEVVRAWDDRPSVIGMWESEGIPVTVVPGWDDELAASVACRAAERGDGPVG